MTIIYWRDSNQVSALRCCNSNNLMSTSNCDSYWVVPGTWEEGEGPMSIYRDPIEWTAKLKCLFDEIGINNPVVLITREQWRNFLLATKASPNFFEIEELRENRIKIRGIEFELA